MCFSGAATGGGLKERKCRKKKKKSARIYRVPKSDLWQAKANLYFVCPADATRTYVNQTSFGNCATQEKARLQGNQVLLYLTDQRISRQNMLSLPHERPSASEAAIDQAIASYKDFRPEAHSRNKWVFLKDLIVGYNAEHDVYILKRAPAEDELKLHQCQKLYTGTFPTLDDRSASRAASGGMQRDLVTAFAASSIQAGHGQPCRNVAGARRGPTAAARRASMSRPVAGDGRATCSNAAAMPAQADLGSAAAGAAHSNAAAMPAGTAANDVPICELGHTGLAATVPASLMAADGLPPAVAGRNAPAHGHSSQDDASSHVSSRRLSPDRFPAGTVVRNVHAAPASLLRTLKVGSRHVFLTGVAGAGKTKFMMDQAMPLLQKRYKNKLWVTASTGIAAQQVNGKTLHSASGLGRGTGDVNELIASMPAVSPKFLYICGFCGDFNL